MRPLVLIALIALVDLMGFTMVMPLLPIYARYYQFEDWQIGLLLAAFPMCQLVSGPILGRLSDRYGRRPILAMSQAGTAISFVLLAFSSSFTGLLLARMLDGASGGNFLVAQAYVADVTRPEDRARGLGLIGAAFGVGFVLGPLLASGLLLLPLHLPTVWQLRVPFLVAAGFSTLAWILVLRFLPESLPADGQARHEARGMTWNGLVRSTQQPIVRLLIVAGALTTLAFASLEGTYSLFLQDRLKWGPASAALGFAFLGLLSAIVQGGLIRPLVSRFGEPRLILLGTFLLAVGMALLGRVRNQAELLIAVPLVAIGSGLASPSILGLLSRSTSAAEQGAVFGTLTSAQTLARMINYFVANRLFGQLGPGAPYTAGAVLSGLAFLTTVALARITGLRPQERNRGPLAGDPPNRGESVVSDTV
jgi:DHA1 family tetracycline resistance protein-like MFS transporter